MNSCHGEEGMRISAIFKPTDNNRRSGSQGGIDADQKQFPSDMSGAGLSSKSRWNKLCPYFERNVHDAPRINQYALYVNEELSSRSSGWLYLSVVSLACLSSFLLTENSMNDDTSMGNTASSYDGGGRSSIDTVLITFLSISFALSFLIALFYHHRDLREKITKDIRHVHNSMEFFLSILMFGFWCTVLRYATDPYSGLTISRIDVSEEIPSKNIWVCTWIGFGLSAYLVGSLIMSSPIRKRGVVCTDTISVRQNTSRRDLQSQATDDRCGEESVVYWFMLLAFSSALAGFSIATRVGAACAGSDLSSSAFCKRSTLGGVIGIICALLACAALVLYRMDKGGIFDIWGSKRKSVVLRINALLACLALILQSVNMGFGTNMSGPSTDINNTCITSYMGTILSLLLCEQAKNRSLLRLLPPPPVRVEKVVEETNLSGGDLGNIDGDNPYSSSSSHASSCAASSELAESFESSSECAVVSTPNVVGQKILGTTDVECGINETTCNYELDRDQSSRDLNSESDGDGSASSSERSSSGSPSNRSSNDTYSTFTPQPPQTYSSSTPAHQQPMRSFANLQCPPQPLTAMYRTEDIPAEVEQNPTDDDSNSYVELSFQPDDDVSSIGFSAIPGDKFGKEPDGYKYDDLYNPSEDPIVHENVPVMMVSRDKMRQNSRRQDTHMALAPVSESTTLTEPCSTSTMSTHQQKVEEIMNRWIDKSSHPYAASQDDRSWTDSDGPPTVNSIGNTISEI